MAEPLIICPTCKTEIKLTESLAAPLVESTRRDFEKRLAAKDSEMAGKLREERTKIAVEESQKAKRVLANDLEQKSLEISNLQEILQSRELKLAEAQKAQTDLIRKQRELDDAKRELELSIEKRVQEGLATVQQKARKEAEDALKLKVSEKEQTILSMQKKIEELQRKAEQGSQQLQGEVLELELEALLKSKFPRDTIEPVPKGEFGGDLLHRVLSDIGQPCGMILWEFKRTKNWSDSWLAKLRDDQRTAKAEISVIVSQNLPQGIEGFDLIEGVWVTHPRHLLPVALALRHTLMEVGAARQASEGQQTKMEMVYQYLTGSRFRQRVQAIAEAFTSMQEDLNSEKKAIMKQWAKREEQIQRVIQATVGMYGDLEGIAGKSLKEIEELDIARLNEPPKKH